MRTADMNTVPATWNSALSISTPVTPIAGMASSGAATSSPKNLAPCRVAALSVTAFSKSLRGTWFGMSADIAGSCVERITPERNVRTDRCHSVRAPVVARTVTMAVSRALEMNVTRAMPRRSIASAISPANGDATRNGSMDAKVTMPTSPELSDFSRMSQDTATMNVHIPAPEHIFDDHVSR